MLNVGSPGQELCGQLDAVNEVARKLSGVVAEHEDVEAEVEVADGGLEGGWGGAERRHGLSIASDEWTARSACACKEEVF